MTTDNPLEPVVVDGTAERVADADARRRFLGLLNATYGTDYPIGFLDPDVNGTCSPTRWVFP